MIRATLKRFVAVALCLSMVCPETLAVRAWAAGAEVTLNGLSVEDDSVTIQLSAAAQYNGFLTANPPRLVIELFDTENQVGAKEIAGKGAYLKRVRAGQFQRSPRMVSRIVMDLNEMAGYRVAMSGNDLIVQLVGDGSAQGRTKAAELPGPSDPAPAARPRLKPKPAAEPLAVAAAAPVAIAEELAPMPGDEPAQPEAKAPAAVAAAAVEDNPRRAAKPSSGVAAGRGDIMGRLPRDLVTLDFDNTDIKDVVKLLAAKARVNIIHGPDVAAAAPITLHLSDVPFNEAFRTILAMTGLVTSQVGDNILRIMTPGQLAKERTTASTITKVIPLNYSKAQEIMAAITAVRTAEGRSGTTSADTKTNSVIVTESLDGMSSTERLIAALDVRPKQVLIEAKLVEVSLNNSLHYGIQWSYFGLDNGRLGGQLGTNVIGGSIAPGSTIGKPFDRRTDNVITSGVGATGAGTGVTLPASSVFGALTLGRVTNNYYLNASLTAAAAQGKVKVLSDPKIATLNNQPANINVTTSTPYVTSNVASTGVATQTVSYIVTGIKLSVTPTINADGRITLVVNPDVSQPSATAAASTTGAPAYDARSAQTTVLVKDGETIVIGGLISDSMSNQVAKIPLLGDIPILGWLFRKKSVVRTRSELLIFVTPKIMPD